MKENITLGHLVGAVTLLIELPDNLMSHQKKTRKAAHKRKEELLDLLHTMEWSDGVDPDIDVEKTRNNNAKYFTYLHSGEPEKAKDYAVSWIKSLQDDYAHYQEKIMNSLIQ